MLLIHSLNNEELISLILQKFEINYDHVRKIPVYVINNLIHELHSRSTRVSDIRSQYFIIDYYQIGQSLIFFWQVFSYPNLVVLLYFNRIDIYEEPYFRSINRIGLIFLSHMSQSFILPLLFTQSTEDDFR